MERGPRRGMNGPGPWSLLVGGSGGHDAFMGYPPHAPLEGRDTEVAAMLRVLEASRLGEPQVVLVEGEAGIGKSRLVAEVTTDLPADVATVVVGCSGPTHRDIPWTLVIQLLDQLQRLDPEAFARVAAPFRDVVDALLTPQGPQQPGASRTTGRVYAAVAAIVLRVAESRPLVAVVEDVHWADPASLAALAHLVATARDVPLALVLTRRDQGDHGDDASALTDLLHACRPTRVGLGRLEPAAVVALVHALRESPAPPELTTWVVTRSGGVPFLVEELVAAVSTGADPLASDVVDHLPGLRLDGLGRHERSVVDAAALAVAPPTAPDLMGAAGVAPAEFDVALAEVLRRGVLVRDRGTLRFRHALVQEAARELVLPHAAQEHHARWAEVLDRRPGLDVAISRAHHLREAARPDEALDACLAAAELARRASAFPAEAEMLVHAADLWAQVPGAPTRTGRSLGDVVAAAADASFRGADVQERTMDLIRRARACTGSEAPSDGTAWLGILWMMCHGGHGQPLEEKLRLVAGVPSRPLTRRRVTACGLAAEWLCEAARPEEAEPFSLEAVAGARSLQDPALEADALTQLGNVERRLGRFEESFATLRRARDLAAQSGDLWSVALQAVFEGGTLSEVGRLVEAFEVYASALDRLGGDRPGPLPFAWAMLTLNLGENALERGDWRTAATLLGRLEEMGPIHERSDEYAQEILMRLRLWRDGTVPPLDGEQGRVLEITDLDTAELQNIASAHRLRLDVHAHVGEVAAARDAFLRLSAIDGIAQMPSALYPTLLTIARLEADVARGLVPEQDPCGRDEVVDAVLAQLALLDARSPLQEAFDQHLRAEVLRVRGEDTSSTWAGAVEAWRGAPDRRSLVLALMRLAETSAAEGLQRDARVALVEAMSIATELGAQPLLHDGRMLASRAGIRLPVAAQRRAGGRNPLDLTAREVEILGLVAQGAANKEIAKALVISPRTVSVHLAHINEKLGVQSRTAAVAEGRARGLLTPELR